MDLHELLEKAADAFAKGKFEKAAKLYTDYCHADPESLQARMRLGDAYARCGQKEKAIAAYQTAAAGYAKEGLLPRAIAASKLILQLDPTHQPIQRLLADLYARRTQDAQPTAEEQVAQESAGNVGESGKPSWFAPTRHAPTPPPDPAPARFDLSSELPPELARAEGESSLLQKVELTAAEAIRSFEHAQDRVQSSKDVLVSAPAPDPAIHTLRKTLPHVPLFSDLEPNPFTALIQRCPLRTLKNGEQVFQQGSHGDAFYVICSGSVRVVRQENENLREVAILKEGSFFGEMAILSDAPRTATVLSASEVTQLLEISAEILKELTARYPKLALALKKFCRQRLLSNVMNSSELFRPFTKQERKTMIERFRAKEVLKDTVILKEGEHSDGLYVVLSGEVEVRRGGSLLAKLKEGEIFGEMSLLNKSVTVATILATRRTSLLRLPRSEFDALIMSHPQVLELVAGLTELRRAKLSSAEPVLV